MNHTREEREPHVCMRSGDMVKWAVGSSQEMQIVCKIVLCLVAYSGNRVKVLTLRSQQSSVSPSRNWLGQLVHGWKRTKGQSKLLWKKLRDLPRQIAEPLTI